MLAFGFAPKSRGRHGNGHGDGGELVAVSQSVGYRFGVISAIGSDNNLSPHHQKRQQVLQKSHLQQAPFVVFFLRPWVRVEDAYPCH